MEIVDRTAETAGVTHNARGFTIHSRSGTTRDLAGVDAIMLHQMGFDRGNDLARYNTVIGHYAVTRDGTIGLLRPLNALLNDARPRQSVHIEFAGDYPSHQGRSALQPPPLVQVRAGRWLVRHICESAGLRIRHIIAHRQWNPDARPRDPGPHLWYNVGLWGKHALGLNSEPPDTHTGNIPAAWESSRFDVDAHGTGNRAGWTNFLRFPSHAIGVKLYDGGVIGIYDCQRDAHAERDEGQAWPTAGTWECWVRRRSLALEVEVMEGGIVGFYEGRSAAEAEADPGHRHVAVRQTA